MRHLFRFMFPRFDAEGAAGGGSSEPAAPTPAPVAPAASSTVPVQPVTPTTPVIQNPLRAGKSIADQKKALEAPATPIVPAVPAASSTEPAQPTQPNVEELDWAGRKVKVTDPVMKDLHKDYSNLNSAYTRSQQQVKDLEAQLQKPPVATPPAPVTPVQPTAPTQERIQAINEKYLEMVYEDPVGANVWLNQQPEYQQMLRPIQQQHMESYMTDTQKREQERIQRVTQARTTVEGKYADYQQMLPAMQDVVNRFPFVAEQLVNNPTTEVFESLYWMAKGTNGSAPAQPTDPAQPVTPPVAPASVPVIPATPAAPPVTAEQLLADPNFIKQIVENADIKNAIITNYIQGVNSSQSQTPVLIGNQSGGQSPAAPDFKPKNIQEAGKAFRSWRAGRT